MKKFDVDNGKIDMVLQDSEGSYMQDDIFLKEIDGYRAKIKRLDKMLEKAANEPYENSQVVAQALTFSEKILYEFKRIKKFIHKDTQYAKFEELGQTDYYDASFEKIDGGYRFILPPMWGKPRDISSVNDGRYIYYVTNRLMNEYNRTHKREEYLVPIPEAMVVFVHHFKVGSKIEWVKDIDNIDSKRFIDAVQGKLIRDDNMFVLNTAHLSLNGTKDYTEVFLLRPEKAGLKIHEVIDQKTQNLHPEQGSKNG